MPKANNKDVVKRETIFKNFDRIVNKIQKGKFTTNASKESIMAPNAPGASNAGMYRDNRVTASEFVKAKQRQEFVRAPTSNYPPANPCTSQMNSVRNPNASTSSPRTNAPTWDAVLRQSAPGVSVNLLKEYRIPKKAPESYGAEGGARYDAAYSTAIAQKPIRASSTFTHHSRPASSSTQQPRAQNALTYKTPGLASGAPLSHPGYRPGHSGQLTTQHGQGNQSSALSSVKPGGSYRSPSSTTSTVKQLASEPANKVMISPVDRSAPFSSFTDNRVLQQTQAQGGYSYAQSKQQGGYGDVQSSQQHVQRHPASFPQHSSSQSQSQSHHASPNQPLPASSGFSSQQPHQRLHQGQYVHSASSSMSTASTPQVPVPTHQPVRSQYELQQKQQINDRLPANMEIQNLPANVNTGSLQRLPGTLPSKPTLLPVSSEEVRAGQVLSQKAVGQSTVYLGSFDPEKPWPTLPVPDVMSQLKPPQSASDARSSTTQAQQHGSAQRTHFHQETSHQKCQHQNQGLPARPPANHEHQQYPAYPNTTTARQPHHTTQYGQSQPAHLDSSKADSDIESYSTHHSPCRPPTHDRQPAPTTTLHQRKNTKPQMDDIEVKQLKILSDLRKTVGLRSPQTSARDNYGSQKNTSCDGNQWSQGNGTTVCTQQLSSNSRENHITAALPSNAQEPAGKNLHSQIGHVIENVVRSEKSKLKEVTLPTDSGKLVFDTQAFHNLAKQSDVQFRLIPLSSQVAVAGNKPPGLTAGLSSSVGANQCDSDAGVTDRTVVSNAAGAILDDRTHADVDARHNVSDSALLDSDHVTVTVPDSDSESKETVETATDSTGDNEIQVTIEGRESQTQPEKNNESAVTLGPGSRKVEDLPLALEHVNSMQGKILGQRQCNLQAKKISGPYLSCFEEK